MADAPRSAVPVLLAQISLYQLALLQSRGEERHGRLSLAKDNGGAYGYAGMAEPHTQAE